MMFGGVIILHDNARPHVWMLCFKHYYGNSPWIFLNIHHTARTSRRRNATSSVHCRKLCRDGDFLTIMSSKLLLKIGSTFNTGTSSLRVPSCRRPLGFLFQPIR
ncbi:hypothetical protein TNCV_675191 [Trichonephila clavipes]|nr:hypothetical protein TNCV_675191 [Trichonephila clavipes]